MPGEPAEPPTAFPWRGLLAVVWLVAAGLASLAPALAHGSKLGTYDVGAGFGLGQPAAAAPYNPVASDQVQQTIPWTELDWTEVHDGHLPLWNPYAAMGTPLLANFQSAGLSLPAILSYLAPRRFAYDVLVFVKLVIAGTGLLFTGRVLRLGWAAAAFAATVGELSGAFSGWLGWPMAGVLCWTGWVLGAGLLLAEARRTRVALPLLAFSTAFAVYGGHPESVLLLATTVTLPVLVVLVAGRSSPSPLPRRILTIIGAVVAGLALSAPLLLPGAQALHGSVHQNRTGYYAFPLRVAGGLIFSGWWGYPVRTSQYFGPANYYETAAYVGLAALALAVVGLHRRWRQPAVLGIAAAAAVLAAVLWSPTVAGVIDGLPGGKLVVWNRALIPLDLVIALLAGVGLDALVSARGERRVARGFAVAAAAAAAALAAFGWHDAHHPPGGVAAGIRAAGFGWPAAQAATLLVAAALTLAASRAGPRARARTVVGGAARVGLAAVVVAEVGFLVAGHPRLWSSDTTGFTVTRPIAALKAAVGEERVGFDCPDAAHFADLGILPESNAAYGIAEAEMYDAVLPLSYLSTYARLTGTARAEPNSGNFCVPVTSAAVGREYGIEYVLKARGAPGPPGALAVGRIGGEYLWRIPGASVVTVQPLSAPLDDPAAAAVPLGAYDAHPARLVLHLHAAAAARLELHLGAYPGWHARLDGRALPLRRLYGVELQAQVPSGVHTVVVTYRPGPLATGLWVAFAGLLALLGYEVVAAAPPRRRGPARTRTARGRPARTRTVDPEGEDDRSVRPASVGRPLTSGVERAWRNRQTRQV